MSRYQSELGRISAVRGVRGAMLVSTADGLVVAESLMDGVDGRAVAALAASLAGRLARTTAEAGLEPPRVLHLHAERGNLVAVPAAAAELLVVAVTQADANLGLARLEMLDVAQGLA